MSTTSFRTSWTIEQRTFCVERHNHHGSIKTLHAEFREKFDCNKTPHHSVILRWLKNFKLYGSVRNQNAKSNYKLTHSGRPKKRTAEAVELVQNSVGQSPKRSVRKRAQSLGLGSTTCWRILKHDLHLKSYRIQMHQVLSTSDKEARMQMSLKIIEKSARSPNFVQCLWTSDEAHFHLHGRVNSKTNVFWGSSKPIEVQTVPLHSPKCTVWAAISWRGVIGPFFSRMTTVAPRQLIRNGTSKFWRSSKLSCIEDFRLVK